MRSDRLELNNRAADPRERENLDRMRTIYDGWVEQWQTHAVPYHDYRRFADLFRRRTLASE